MLEAPYPHRLGKVFDVAGVRSNVRYARGERVEREFPYSILVLRNAPLFRNRGDHVGWKAARSLSVSFSGKPRKLENSVLHISRVRCPLATKWQEVENWRRKRRGLLQARSPSASRMRSIADTDKLRHDGLLVAHSIVSSAPTGMS